MKLRNKKTGAIVERVYITIREEGVTFNSDETYGSLAELNAEWEDYVEPKEPLIEYEEIREIIRPWAKLNGAMELKYDADENSLTDLYRNTISFNRLLDLKDEYSYTIAELCGEEEE